MKRIAGPVLIFTSYLALVGAASTLDTYSPVAKYADAVMVGAHCLMLVLLSFYVVRDRIRGPVSCPMSLHQRLRRWMTDEREHPVK